MPYELQKQKNIGLITRKIKIFLDTNLPGSMNDKKPSEIKDDWQHIPFMPKNGRNSEI